MLNFNFMLIVTFTVTKMDRRPITALYFTQKTKGKQTSWELKILPDERRWEKPSRC